MAESTWLEWFEETSEAVSEMVWGPSPKEVLRRSAREVKRSLNQVNRERTIYEQRESVLKNEIKKRAQVRGPGGLWGVSPQFYPPTDATPFPVVGGVGGLPPRLLPTHATWHRWQKRLHVFAAASAAATRWRAAWRERISACWAHQPLPPYKTRYKRRH